MSTGVSGDELFSGKEVRDLCKCGCARRSRSDSFQLRLKEPFYGIKNSPTCLRLIDRFAQRRPAGNAMREPRSELLHFALRFRIAFIEQHLEVGADHTVTIHIGWFVVAAGCRVLCNLPKDPRIRRSRTPNHHRITI